MNPVPRPDAAAAFPRRPTPAWDRRDTAVSLLAVFAVIARWPDRARSLQSWDANTFALALERYDVFAHRPHAPGYPVYVVLGRMVHAVVPDANDALVALSLLFTAVAMVALYALGREVVGRAPAVAAVLLLLAAPVAYVHSVTANAYSAEMAGSILVAWAAWRAHHDPRPSRIVLLAFALAVAVGVRPSLAFYLAPLAAWAVLQPPWDLRTQVHRLGPAAGVGIVTCLAWFLPMIALSGGYGPWRDANRIQGGQVVFADTLFNAGWPAVAANLDRLGLFLQWELRWLVPVALVLTVAGAIAARQAIALPRPAWDGPGMFMALWLAPALLFFATVYSGYHEGPSGYILVVLPGLLLAVCALVAWVLRRVPFRADAVAAVATFALLVSGGGLAAHRHDVADVGYREHDAWWEAWSQLPASFPPSNSSIVALWHFAHVWQGFPEYTTYNYRPLGEGPEESAMKGGVFIQVARGHEATPDWYTHDEPNEAARHPLPEGTRHLVLFDFQLAGENGGPRRVLNDIPVREAFLPNGWRVLVVDVTADRPDLEDYFARDPDAVT